jgi:hypothetical protein
MDSLGLKIMAVKSNGTRALTTPPKRKSAHRTEVAADDVIDQLLELLDQLGISSKHVADRLRDHHAAKITTRHIYPKAAVISELLTSWHQDANYLDPQGVPLPIRYRGKNRSFCALAGASVPDMTPKLLLSELLRVKAVSMTKDRLVKINTRSVPVYKNKQLAVQHTITSLDDFLKTLIHNLSSGDSNSRQLFHRIARSNAFESREIPALKSRIRRQGQQFLESCDNWMSKRKANKNRYSSVKRGKPSQVSVGVYLSVERGQ